VQHCRRLYDPAVGHYETLGVDPAASMVDIRRSYLRLAREAHPDFHHGSREKVHAEARMREINAAWAILSDIDERSAYDRERLRNAAAPRRAPFHGSTRAHEAWRPFDATPEKDFDDRDDRPITTSRLPRWLQMLPVLLMATGFAGVFLGSLVGIVAVVGLGIMALLASAVLFLAAPIFAVAVSRHEDRNA
jgi:DnaJ domain